MEIKGLIYILIAVFSVFLIVLAMDDAGIDLESGAWATISASLAYFIIFIMAFVFVLWFIRERGVR